MERRLLLIAGILLWWAEGTKSRKDKRWKNAVTYPVEITNTDPKIIKLFLTFLRKDLKVNPAKIKIQLQIHANDDVKKTLHFWSTQTQIPLKQFQKTIIRPRGQKIGKTQGTCKVRFNDKRYHLQLQEELDNLLKELHA